ncbi:hypothetical protein BGW37DRAFT_517266 [Umbelopsis sp. PMI_123]|nr:hypothetical protein BGW37DRAFT_517266 [Umbelopsis sp. PMI_123]
MKDFELAMAVVKELIKNRSYRHWYLPPDSPFLNPIEVWSNVKAAVRRNSLSPDDRLSDLTCESVQMVTQEDIFGFAEIEENLPTAKTASIRQYHKYIENVLEHMETIFLFYSFNRGEMKIHNYQGKQKALEEIAYIFLDSGKKDNAKKRKHNRRRHKMRRFERQAATPAPTLATDPRSGNLFRT